MAEAAPVDRGTHFGVFWRVGLPLAVPGIIVPQRYLMRGMTLGAAYGCAISGDPGSSREPARRSASPIPNIALSDRRRWPCLN